MKPRYISKKGLRLKYGLTTSQIVELGKPDLLVDNPRFPLKGAKMQLYLLTRVELWLARQQQGIPEPKVDYDWLRRLLKTFVIRETLPRGLICLRIREQLKRRNPRFQGAISEKLICSYIRHYYTSYPQILTTLRETLGLSEVYENVKVYVCCQIIDHFELDLDPLTAAFDEIPERFQEMKDVETGVEKLLGIEKISRYVREYSERNVRKMISQIVDISYT